MRDQRHGGPDPLRHNEVGEITVDQQILTGRIVMSMNDASWVGRPSNVGGFPCIEGNFSAPLVVSSCLMLLATTRLLSHRALACQRGPYAFWTT